MPSGSAVAGLVLDWSNHRDWTTGLIDSGLGVDWRWGNKKKSRVPGVYEFGDWNGGMESGWSGLLEWSTGLDYWSATPTNAQFGPTSMATNLILNAIAKAAGRGSMN